MNRALPVLLLISTDKRIIALLKRLLKEHYNFLESATVEDAEEWLGTTAIDLLIIDEKATGSSFTDLCVLVRKTRDPLSLSILLITNNLKKAFIQRALNIGVNDFINDPFEKDELFQRLAVLDKAKEMQHKLASVRGYLSKDFKERDR